MNKLRQWFRWFMTGRYGTDKLNMALLIAALVLCILPTLLGLFGLMLKPLSLLFALASYALTGYAIFRCFSRNSYKRYEENRRYLRLLDRLKDREHKYFECPRCRQPVRVPRGKGKIAITCPKCKEKFIRKT